LALFAAYAEVVEEVMGGAPLPTAPVPITPAVDARETRQLSPLPLPVKPGPIGEPDPVPGEVPEDLLTNILTDLQERKGIATEEITIERAEAVVWSDGSLGCPQPGMMYLQVLTPGYLVVLRVGEDLYNTTLARAEALSCANGVCRGDPAARGRRRPALGRIGRTQICTDQHRCDSVSFRWIWQSSGSGLVQREQTAVC
jgi:hypothetical protein